jgi:predicted PurR-regulated permease PerM
VGALAREAEPKVSDEHVSASQSPIYGSSSSARASTDWKFVRAITTTAKRLMGDLLVAGMLAAREWAVNGLAYPLASDCRVRYGGAARPAPGVHFVMMTSHATPPPPQSRDVARITLGVLFIGLMIVASLWVLRPFLAAAVWATMVVVATWPLMLALQARLGGRRWLAVTLMTAAMLLLLVVPLVLAVTTIVDHAGSIADWTEGAVRAGVPPPPEWIERIPLVGMKLRRDWQQLAAIGREELALRAAPYARIVVLWLASQAGNLGLLLLHFLLTVVITGILYTTGETAARGVRRFARRLAADRGDDSVVLAGQAIRAVALGVVVTAIVQSAAAGIGLGLAGIPYATVLTAVIFILCIAQIGPLLVLAPAVGWLYWSGDAVWGSVLLVWTLVVGTLDNVLRPVLIRRGADLPLLLIFAGVVGGLVSFGVIGLFVGPVILAVTYRLLESWIAEIDRQPGHSAPPAPVVAVQPARDPGNPVAPV